MKLISLHVPGGGTITIMHVRFIADDVSASQTVFISAG